MTMPRIFSSSRINSLVKPWAWARAMIRWLPEMAFSDLGAARMAHLSMASWMHVWRPVTSCCASSQASTSAMLAPLPATGSWPKVNVIAFLTIVSRRCSCTWARPSLPAGEGCCSYAFFPAEWHMLHDEQCSRVVTCLSCRLAMDWWNCAPLRRRTTSAVLTIQSAARQEDGWIIRLPKSI